MFFWGVFFLSLSLCLFFFGGGGELCVCVCWGGELCVFLGGGGVALLNATVPCLLFSTSDSQTFLFFIFNLNGGKGHERYSIETRGDLFL